MSIPGYYALRPGGVPWINGRYWVSLKSPILHRVVDPPRLAQKTAPRGAGLRGRIVPAKRLSHHYDAIRKHFLMVKI